MSERRRRDDREEAPWVPRTKLGKMVQEGKMTSLDEIFQLGLKLREPEIVKTLVPDLKSEVVSVGIVQKQTDAGELTRFGAVVAVGNGNGFFGVGKGKAAQMKSAIDKATNDALLNVIPIQIGCGSWECRCGTKHSVPYRIVGKAGSVRVVSRDRRWPCTRKPPSAGRDQGCVGADVRFHRHTLVARQRRL